MQTFGKHSYHMENFKVLFEEGCDLYVGAFSSIGENVTIFLGGNHRYDWITTYPFPFKWDCAKYIPNARPSNGDVVIGNDVWVGNNSTIMSGVTIGDGAVIATRSVITKNVLPYAVMGGNPAKLIKMRFKDEDIAFLLKLKWWNWSEEKIKEKIDILMSPDISKLRS